MEHSKFGMGGECLAREESSTMTLDNQGLKLRGVTDAKRHSPQRRNRKKTIVGTLFVERALEAC